MKADELDCTARLREAERKRREECLALGAAPHQLDRLDLAGLTRLKARLLRDLMGAPRP